jgi:hypothetical protein
MNLARRLGCMFCCGALLMAAAFLAIALYQSPRQLELPAAMPLVLGLSTDLGVEQTIKLLGSVDNDDVTVKVIQNERLYLKKIPLRQMLVVKKVVIPGLSEKELRCFFLRNRLMEVVFKPKLTEDECKLLFVDDSGRFMTPGEMAGLKDIGYYSGDCAGEDQLEMIDYVWGSGVRSALLSKAYFILYSGVEMMRVAED